jgi:hypothetical protein
MRAAEVGLQHLDRSALNGRKLAVGDMRADIPD